MYMHLPGGYPIMSTCRFCNTSALFCCSRYMSPISQPNREQLHCAEKFYHMHISTWKIIFWFSWNLDLRSHLWSLTTYFLPTQIVEAYNIQKHTGWSVQKFGLIKTIKLEVLAMIDYLLQYFQKIKEFSFRRKDQLLMQQRWLEKNYS